jgi:hypothetical protein
MTEYPFTITGGPAPFSDTIRMEASEWEAMPATEQDALKMARFNAWIDAINVPLYDPEVVE